MTIRVAVDAMGSDRGPEDIVAGAVEAATDQLQPVIVGPTTLDTQGLELIEAPDVIEMDEKPTEAVRAKERSSLVIACRAVGDCLTAIMQERPDQCLTVLCGHTHSAGSARISANLVVHTGGAEYGEPTIQNVFEL